MTTVLTATAFIPLMAGLFLPGNRNGLEGLLSSLFGFGTVVVYYGVLSLLGHPDENDSYTLAISLFCTAVELSREYSLFFALPASAAGFILGSFLGGDKR